MNDMILVLMNRNSSGWSFAVVLKRTVTDYSILNSISGHLSCPLVSCPPNMI